MTSLANEAAEDAADAAVYAEAKAEWETLGRPVVAPEVSAMLLGGASLVTAIRKSGCITSATPFDEKSVDLCVELGVQILKIASSDLNDLFLLEKIAKTR